MNKQEIINFLRVNEIWAKKSMGQNFLIDNRALTRIVEAADLDSADTVIEIGPGLGVLTAELLKRAKKVIAIEKDDKLAQALKFKIQNPNVKILNQDALKYNSSEIGKYKVVANIPYNITSLIIRKFSEAENKPQLLVLLVQKEVAERIVAKPGEMSLLSVSVQYYAEPRIISIVPAASFFPAPKVDSAIIKLKIKSSEAKVPEKEFFRLVKFGFSAKRKTLENNLAAGMHIPKNAARDIIKRAGLDANVRAEALSIADWIKLFETIKEEKGGEKEA